MHLGKRRGALGNMQMIYQSTVDTNENSVIVCSIKKAPYGNVSVICYKMLSVVLYFHPQSPFFFRARNVFSCFRLCVAVC